MEKTVTVLLVVVLLGSPLGCANIKDDPTRTKTEGTLTGAGVGAVIGGLIGLATGDKKGAGIGAGIGALAGGLAGYMYGSHVADKKAEYASREEWLDACLQQAESTNKQLKDYNEQLATDIKSLDAETKALKKAVAAKKANQDSLRAQKAKIEDQLHTSKELAKGVDEEIVAQERVLADAKANNKNQEATLLEAEIDSLKRQKAQLEESNKQLAGMSSRISV